MKLSRKTPTGVKLFYHDEDDKRFYTVNGNWVPSVTTILSVLDKPALPWWGMKIGVEGVMKLYRDHDYSFSIEDTVDDVVALLKEHKLTTNHVLKVAGGRGNSVHDAFETWSGYGFLPDPNDYPEHERGYIAGLKRFLVDIAVLDPIESEVMVGSAVHGFAGRFDLLAALWQEREVVVKNLKRGPRKATLYPGRYLLDLKTSKGVYETHHLQLAAYEGALREGGWEATDYRMVVKVAPDGTYECHVSEPCWPQFLAVLGAYKAMQTFKKGRK